MYLIFLIYAWIHRIVIYIKILFHDDYCHFLSLDESASEMNSLFISFQILLRIKIFLILKIKNFHTYKLKQVEA
jgi:hypothetical protein